MNARYSKPEKLKSQKTIDALFAKGQSASLFPLRLVYIKKSGQDTGINFGVSVSKRYQKRAVDRNYLKRIMREIYRQNKGLLTPTEGYVLMLLYQSKEILPYTVVKTKTIALFEKFSKQVERPKNHLGLRGNA